MANYNYINELLYKFSSLGVKTIEKTGATLIGYAPFIAPEAWLNHLFKPLTMDSICLLEDRIKRPIPDGYRDFLMYFSNGLNVMNGHLSLFGLRTSYSRDTSDRQPFDLTLVNTIASEKPFNSTKEMFFFGSYMSKGSKLYFDKDSRVCFCSRENATPLKTWNNLIEMLESELIRIYKLFDESGHPLGNTPDFWGFLEKETEPVV